MPAARNPGTKPGPLYRLVRALAVLAGLVALGLVSAYTAMLLALEPDRVEVARVVGVESVAAGELLKEGGLVPRVIGEDFHPRIPKGHVASQRPPAGSRAKIGSEVRLIVSRGTDQIVVPDVAGKTLAQAQRTLSEAGLSTGQVSRTHSEAHAREQVIAQEPQPGAQVVRGSPIHLLQSLGPYEGTVIMPEVRGRELVSAANLLKELQLDPLVLFRAGPEGPGRVIEQEPAAGQQIHVGAKVRITVAE
jgi:serine/threonine-protein kinase